MGMLMQAMKNPQSFLQQAMQNNQMMQNPMLKNAIEMYQRGDREGVNRLAQNLCKEKGTSFEQMAQQIKSQFGM
jgi:hypothetical protein